jgi:transketolase
MRNAFAAELTELAAEDRRVALLSGDIGNQLFDKFKATAPERFFNCGVAEANMIGVAAGLGLSGFRPVVYTITPFLTTRCLEQIRVDICYHHVPVTLVGVGAGLSYASLGPTHHSLEDIAFLRALPNMKIVCPGDAFEVRAALRAALAQDDPVYIRIGKRGEPVVHDRVPADFAIGRGLVLHEGGRVWLLSTGNLLPIAVEAAHQLNQLGIDCGLVSFHTVKPLDLRLLDRVFGASELVVTIEEHSLIGGLGSAVAEWLADAPPQPARLLRIGTPDAFFKQSGEQEYAREQLGLSVEAIVERVSARLPRRRGPAAAAAAPAQRAVG